MTGWVERIGSHFGAAEADDLAMLVARALRAGENVPGADPALRHLIEVVTPSAVRFVRCFGVPDADVDDVVQEALLQLARSLPDLREPRAFSHWFARVVRTACLQWTRRRRRPPSAPFDDWADAGDGSRWDPPDGAAFHAFATPETHDLVTGYLATLPERERQVVARYYLGDLTYAEIARELGLSERAVEGLLYRAMRHLRAVAESCADEPVELGVWCAICGMHRLSGYFRPGDSPATPLWIQATCPGCQPGYYWWMTLALDQRSYLSLDAAFARGADHLGRVARSLVRQDAPRCVSCQSPLRHLRPWEPVDRAGQIPNLVLRWECPTCHYSIQSQALVVAESVPAWQAFRASAPRLVVGRQRLVGQGVTRRLVISARDLESGRQGRLTIGTATLRVEGLEVEG